MRTCPGDLNWATLTCVGHGGSVQLGTICMYSSGGQQSQVTVRGSRVDLQEYGPQSLHERRYSTDSATGFVWKPNRLAGLEDVYQLNSSLLPFGTKLMRTTAVVADGNRMVIKLDYVPNPDSTSSTRPIGTLKATLENRLATDLTDCWLVVSGKTDTDLTEGVAPEQTNLSDRLDMWHSLGPIRAGTTHSGDIDSTFHSESLNSNYQYAHVYELYRSMRRRIETPVTGLRLPLSLVNGSAAIVGQLRGSPEIEIDTEQTDFVPTEGIHYFFQSIAPEDISQSLKEALRQWQRTRNLENDREQPQLTPEEPPSIEHNAPDTTTDLDLSSVQSPTR